MQGSRLYTYSFLGYIYIGNIGMFMCAYNLFWWVLKQYEMHVVGTSMGLVCVQYTESGVLCILYTAILTLGIR